MSTRLTYNGLTSALNSSLTSGGTSVTFAAALTHSGGTAVPTISGGNYIPLAILNASGVLSEIVYLTAYTAGATTGTISRGQEGTTAVAHASGDKLVNALTVLDLVPATPPAYATYTPALTATTTNPTLGTGATATGRWKQTDKTVHCQINLTFGTSGSAVGSGNYRVSLPAAAASGPDVFGSGYVYDSSTGDIRPVVVSRVTSTTAQFAYNGSFVGHGTPWAWAASDQLQFNLVYEAA